MTYELQSKPRSWSERMRVVEAIRFAEDFTTGGSLRGQSWHLRAGDDSGMWAWGQLPAEWKLRLRETGADFIVFSYATPIAWRGLDGEWVVPDVKYSPTTSAQQSIVRQAVG